MKVSKLGSLVIDEEPYVDGVQCREGRLASYLLQDRWTVDEVQRNERREAARRGVRRFAVQATQAAGAPPLTLANADAKRKYTFQNRWSRATHRRQPCRRGATRSSCFRV